jgi:3-deoxy-D-manno-octulosonic-acid transferase
MVWSLFYRIGIVLLSVGIRLAAYRSSKVKIRKKAQSEWFAHWQKQLETRLPNQRTIWFHCASLGEFDAMIPVLQLIRSNKNIDWFIAISFFSPSGYEKRKNHPLADATGYLPLDFATHATRLVSLIKPEIAVFVKYEFWKFHFKAIKKHGASLIVSGVRFAPNTPYFGWLSGMYRPIFSMVDKFLVQDSQTANILLKHGFSNVAIVGDSRIDRSFQTVAEKQHFSDLETAISGKQVLVVGSTWPEDERVWIPAWKQLYPRPYLIVAPHEPSTERIAKIEESVGMPLGRWSKRQEGLQDSAGLIIDTIGDLSSVYRYASVAYVGGAFGSGLHNIIEPLIFGVPVVFGPKTARFPEAQDATKGGFGLSVQDETTAIHALSYFLKNANHKEKILEYLSANKGASQRIFQELFMEAEIDT